LERNATLMWLKSEVIPQEVNNKINESINNSLNTQSPMERSLWNKKALFEGTAFEHTPPPRDHDPFAFMPIDEW